MSKEKIEYKALRIDWLDIESTDSILSGSMNIGDIEGTINDHDFQTEDDC